MRFLTRWGLSLAVLAVLTLTPLARGEKPAVTTITIPRLHCPVCAKKVADKLQAVPNVASVQTDLDALTAVVTPRPDTVLSPRLLWEAVEKAGKKPSKLEGPSGTFTSKPES